MKKKLKVNDILLWLIQNKEDTQSMDAINFQSFPYTSKYRRLHNSAPTLPIEEQNLDNI